MASKTLTLKDFESEISTVSNLEVNLSLPQRDNKASPIHLCYHVDEVKIVSTFPEMIILKSGESILSIGQVNKIVRKSTDFETYYEVYCGYLETLETKIRITLI